MAPLAKRNRFNNTWDNLFTCNMGKLICYDVIPVLPGDNMRVVHEQVTKAQALTTPAFGKLTVRLMDFFVPTRELWSGWEEYWSAGLDGTDTGHVFPYMEFKGNPIVPPGGGSQEYSYVVGSTGDYLGYPLNQSGEVGAFKHRGIVKIINDWFINQDLEDPLSFSIEDGKDTTTDRLHQPFNINWKRDYFTGCLPWQQKGDPVGLPVLPGSVTANTSLSADGNFVLRDIDDSSSIFAVAANSGSVGGGSRSLVVSDEWSSSDPVFTEYNSGIKALTTVDNSSGVRVGNMNDLAVAQQVQRLFTLNARSGSRYIEKLLANFGVRSSDGRLQRSEYLGGSKSHILVSEILQTSGTTASSVQGNQAGHAYGYGVSGKWNKTFEEFGYVFCFYVIAPKAVYSQGMPREDMKRDPLEFALPLLTHLPEDAVYDGELFWHGGYDGYSAEDAAANKKVFGYRPRYDDYRHHYSRVAGDFRPVIRNSSGGTDRGQLADWTFTRSFSNQPELNKEFISVEDIRRPFATEGTIDHLFMACVTTNMRVRRALPKQGLPAGTF